MSQAFRTQLYINGAYVDPVRGGTFTTYNPATNQPITEVANATSEDIDLAVAAAQACVNGPNWGYKSTGAQRAQILRKLGEIFTARKGTQTTISFFFAYSTMTLAAFSNTYR